MQTPKSVIADAVQGSGRVVVNNSIVEMLKITIVGDHVVVWLAQKDAAKFEHLAEGDEVCVKFYSRGHDLKFKTRVAVTEVGTEVMQKHGVFVQIIIEMPQRIAERHARRSSTPADNTPSPVYSDRKIAMFLAVLLIIVIIGLFRVL